MFSSLKTLVEDQMRSLFENLLQSRPSVAHPRQFQRTSSDSFYGGEFQNFEGRAPVTKSVSGDITLVDETVGESAQNSLAPADPNAFLNFTKEMGIESDQGFRFPEQNPLTLQKIHWDEEICQDNLDSLSRASLRQSKAEAMSDDAKINRLTHLLLLAMKSGNISLAMILFSHLESTSANQITKCLMEKVQSLQENKRQLTKKMQEQKNDAEGSKNLQTLKNQMEDANDDISVLQTFIRDVAQNKQASMELANAFISKEHETAMAIIRSFGR